MQFPRYLPPPPTARADEQEDEELAQSMRHLREVRAPPRPDDDDDDLEELDDLMLIDDGWLDLFDGEPPAIDTDLDLSTPMASLLTEEWPRAATAEEEAAGLSPDQAVETLVLCRAEPPERMYELQWAYAARQRLSARMRQCNVAWALEEWPASRLGVQTILPDVRLDRFIANAELATLHALSVALAGHTLSETRGLAANAVWRDFQADMRRYARDVKHVSQMGLAAHALDLAATMAREHLPPDAKPIDNYNVDRGAVAFPRFLAEAPALETSPWHAATTGDEAAGLIGNRSVRTFSALFEPRPDSHVEYTGLTHRERGRLQWIYAARQRLSAHMATHWLTAVPAWPMADAWHQFPTTPRLLQCLYAELALCHALHQAVRAHMLMQCQRFEAHTAWAAYVKDMDTYGENRQLNEIEGICEEIRAVAPALVRHAEYLHAVLRDRRARSIAVFCALGRHLPGPLRVHVASLLFLECMDQAERLWRRLRPLDLEWLC